MRRRIPIVAMNVMYDDSSFNLFLNGLRLAPSLRRLQDLKDVVFDKEFYEASVNKLVVLYYMYRDVCREEDRGLLRKLGLRFDITIMPSMLLGKEYVKTMGHYHPVAEGNLTYPEVYEVLAGEAHYLLQREENGKIVDIVLVEAGRASKVLIPPNYGHVTINPLRKTLVMANLVSNQFNSLYDPIRSRGGGAYFELLHKALIRNENYKDVPPLKVIEAKEYKLLPRSSDLYTLLLSTPNFFRFLNEPKRCPVA